MDRHGPHHNLLEVHPPHVPDFGSSGAESEVSYNLVIYTYLSGSNLASLGSSHWIVTENGKIQAQVGKSDTTTSHYQQFTLIVGSWEALVIQVTATASPQCRPTRFST